MTFYNIPGVYSKIDASSAVRALSPSDAVIGIIGKATTGTDNVPYAPSSFDDAKTTFGEDSEIVKIMKVALDNGATKFILCKAEEVEAESTTTVDYQSALDKMELEEAISIILVDSTSSTVHSLVKAHCVSASDNRRERVSFLGFAANADATSAKTAAAALNSGLVYVAYPNLLDKSGTEVSGIYTAAALAGADAAEKDPSMPMTNVQLNGYFGLSKKLKDSEISSLIDNGIIPLEVRNGDIRIVRMVSTYTKGESGATDITWQERTTTKISHYIFKDLRADLSRRFSRAKQNAQSREKVKTAVVNRLKVYEGLEYIENVSDADVSIQVNPSNPTRNDVEFQYDVVTPMNVIHLTGHLVI